VGIQRVRLGHQFLRDRVSWPALWLAPACAPSCMSASGSWSGARWPIRIGHGLGLLDRRLLHDLGCRPFTGPFPFGHECVAEVVRTGAAVRSVAPGDVVVVPFQISCGRGPTAACATDRRTAIAMCGLGEASGGWGGVMSDLLRVPHAEHMLLPVPAGVDPVALASAERLDIAATLGARPRRRRTWPVRDRYPIVVDANGERGALEHAMRSLTAGGVCTSVTPYFTAGTRLPLWTMYVQQASFLTAAGSARMVTRVRITDG